MKKEFLAIWNLVTGEEETGLQGFHLRMARGDFVELLGTERSGKSSIAAFFSGKERIREGFVNVDGVRFREGELLTYSGIQCLGPIPSLAKSLTVAENIILLTTKRRIRGVISRRDIEARANFLLSQFGLSFRAGERVGDLSEGEKRAVELLRAAESETPFLLIDNVFGNLGQADMQIIESCLAELKRRGMTILVLGGGFPRFPNLYDRVVVLRGGRTVRTFYRGSFDRGEYVKWVFGVTDPDQIRDRAVSSLTDSGKRAPFRDGREKDMPGGNGRDRGVRVLRAEGICGAYVRQFSLSVCAGEIVGLYDMNNESNRELLHLLIGEVKTEAGRMWVNDLPYEPKSLEYAFQRGINYIPRRILDCAVVGDMSCGENIALAVMKKNSRFGVLKKDRVIRFLEREYGRELECAIPELAHGYELNSFDRMRVALQRILLARPSLLLLEDTISDMNVRMLRIQTEYFARLTREGCAILISSQNLAALRQVCGRIVVINSNE